MIRIKQANHLFVHHHGQQQKGRRVYHIPVPPWNAGRDVGSMRIGDEKIDVLVERDLEHVLRLPEGHYWVLGDNRGDSVDSRVYGPLARGDILGVINP